MVLLTKKTEESGENALHLDMVCWFLFKLLQSFFAIRQYQE